MKRIIDLVGSFLALLLFSPFIAFFMLLVYLQDGHSPLYVADRIGLNGKKFKMIKLRSMIINADKNGVDSTSSNDNRITAIGRLIRKFKLDELTQLWNVLIGDMSLVGPRPNVEREVLLYTEVEKQLLSVKPGITDFASIVYSDEGEILKDSLDPDLDYHQLIRPGKGELGIYYINNKGIFTDLILCFLTIVAIISKQKALNWLVSYMKILKADMNIINTASRDYPLIPRAPVGAKNIVLSRDGYVDA